VPRHNDKMMLNARCGGVVSGILEPPQRHLRLL